MKFHADEPRKWNKMSLAAHEILLYKYYNE